METGVHGTARNITERKHLEERLRQAVKMEAIGTLAGGLAHDFNNLLQVVLGYAELILLGKEKQDKDYQKARLIYGAATRGRDLVNRILTFSRRVETKPRTINLNDELKQVEHLLGRTIPKMIDIELRLANNLRLINADPTQIEQIILNLALNAAHAMPEGGKLVFETKNVGLDEEYCRTHLETRPGEYVLLTVSDTGHGMEKEILDRVFEPFFTTKQRGQGTGLGLSMVFGIIKSHGGCISCHSQPGAGTVFKIYFPATDVKIALDTASTLEMPSFGTETILLVDDEETIRDLGKEILTTLGYKVLTASNGREALAVYANVQDDVSLVVLDLIMPQMGGKQCLEELLRINPKVKYSFQPGIPQMAPPRRHGSVVQEGSSANPTTGNSSFEQCVTPWTSINQSLVIKVASDCYGLIDTKRAGYPGMRRSGFFLRRAALRKDSATDCTAYGQELLPE